MPQQPGSVPDGTTLGSDRDTTATLTGVTVSCLVRYERARLLAPAREGRRHLYRAGDFARIRKIARLERDLGINLAGIEVILRLTEEMSELQRRLARYEPRKGKE